VLPLPERSTLGLPPEGGYYPTALEYGFKRGGVVHSPRSYIRATVNKMTKAEFAKMAVDIRKGVIREAKKLFGSGK